MKKTILLLLCSGFIVSAALSQPVRKVLIEEFTTASCGNCPMMSQYIRTWHEANAEHTIMVSIHEGSGVDAMSNTNTAAIFSVMHPTGFWFAPAAMIERAIYPSTAGEAYLSCYQSWGSPGGPGIDTIAARLMNEPPVVGVEISGTYNSSTRMIDATVAATFLQPVASGNWRINLFLVEDSVIGWPGLGPFVGWDQHCYDATWANTWYPGMFDGTSIIGYPHRHVMRNSFFGNWGVAGVIPAVPVPGTAYTASASLAVDTAYHEEHLSLVAFVSSDGTTKAEKFVLNANDVKVNSNFATRLPVNESASSALSLFPVPANGEVHLFCTVANTKEVTVEVRDMTGRLVKRQSGLHGAAGTLSTTIDISGLTKGIYFFSVEDSNSVRTTRLVIE